MKINITAAYDVVIDPEGHGYDVNITLSAINTATTEEIYSSVTSRTAESMGNPFENVIRETLIDTYNDIGSLMTHTVMTHAETVVTTVDIASLRQKIQETRKPRNVSANQ